MKNKGQLLPLITPEFLHEAANCIEVDIAYCIANPDDTAAQKRGQMISDLLGIADVLAMAPTHPSPEEIPDGWTLVEKETCYALLDGNTVVATLAGPEAKQNAAIIANALKSQPSPEEIRNSALEEPEKEPIAWESTTVCYTKYITDSRYMKLRPEFRKWYRPYRCKSCEAQPAIQLESEPIGYANITDDGRVGSWLYSSRDRAENENSIKHGYKAYPVYLKKDYSAQPSDSQAEPSDAVVEAAIQAWIEAEGSMFESMREAIKAAMKAERERS